MNECRYKHTERVGLYIMVLLTMLASCDVRDDVRALKHGTAKVTCEVAK